MTSGAVKKALLIGILFIAYVFWQALGTLSQYYPITNYPPKHAGPMVLFGDRFSTSSGLGFVSILEKRLTMPILNQSSVTSTAHEQVKIVSEFITRLKPSVVIFCYDEAANNAVPDSALYLSDLRTMIGAAQKEGAITVILGESREPDDSEYVSMIKHLGRETRSLTVTNILSTIADDPRYWEDGLPNNEGSLRIADLVAPTLEGLTFGNTQEPLNTP